MINIFSFLDFVEHKSRSIKNHPKKCLRAVSKLNNCQMCKNICPTNSITVDKGGIRIDESCIQCGLCTGVCPTEALELLPISQMEIYQAVAFRSKKEEVTNICCLEDPEEYKNEIRIPCIGALSEKLILALMIQDVPPIVHHDKKQCNVCSLGGENIYNERLNKVNAILDEFSYSIKASKDQKTDEPSIDRREFFKNIFNVNKNVSRDVIDYVAENIDDFAEERSEINNFTTIYNDILEKLLINNESTKVIDIFSVPQITGTCTGCKACDKLCPTGAIKLKEDSLILTTSRCIGCGICKDVCYFKGVELAGAKLYQLKKNNVETLTVLKEKTCKKCKFKYRTNLESDLCTACNKKEV